TDVSTYFRGLNGDHVSQSNPSWVRTDNVITAPHPGGGAPASPTYGRTLADNNALRGRLLEHRTLDATGKEADADQHDYTITTLNAGPTDPFGTQTMPV